MGKPENKCVTVALAGNPNVGKSTLFNALTGLRQHTGNWPGKTVQVARGKVRHGDTVFTLVDLPGTYGLGGNSPDEQAAAEYISSGEQDWTVVVCDGSALERTLILALQILNATDKVIVCINLMDEARQRGIVIDGEKLSARLGVPVVMTAGGRKKGLKELLDALLNEKGCVHPDKWEDPVRDAENLVRECVTRKKPEENWRVRLDALLVSRRHGMTLLLLFLFFIVWLTVYGANLPSRWLEELFEMGAVWLETKLVFLPPLLRSFLLDGIYRTCARVISVMLPPMAIFFPLFTLLEDVGYLPRMAFLLDGGMRRCGGCGKQALTLCMGLGCNAVGVTGCRIIDSPRERLLAILTNAMVPCNGRFPTLILLGSLFFPGVGAAAVVGLCVILGVCGAMVSSRLLSRTVLRHTESTFLMELPPLRRPRVLQVLVRSCLDRTLLIGLRALKTAAPAGALLWLLARIGVLRCLADGLDPLGRLMGMNGVILLAFLAALPANELVIPVILMLLSGVGSLQEVPDAAGLILTGAGWDWKTAVCTMVFTLFHWPCATTLLTVRRETGSIAKTAAAAALPTAVGVITCLILNLIFSFPG